MSGYSWTGAGTGAYAATKSTSRRESPKQFITSEDDALKEYDRRRLQATTHDVNRNFSIASWMVRRHLDFVASHYLVCNTEDDSFNRDFEAYIAEKAAASNFDAAGRHSLWDAMRLVESSRTLDGDVFIMRLANGRVQIIESDRVKNPTADKIRTGETWKNGLLLDKFGRTKRIAVWRRSGSGRYEFERLIKAENIWQVGYFSRFDQYRGVSPMSSGLNDLRDVYENKGYALAKAKVSQLFGLKITRNSSNSLPGSMMIDDQEDPRGRYEIDFGKGNVLLDMMPDDDADFLENKTPPMEYQQFLLSTISMAIKSLDLPFNFYQENFTNFFGSKASFLLYQKSTTPKQRQLQKWLYDWTFWQISRGVAAGEFAIPARFNSIGEVPFKWQAEGLPWWDLAREIGPTIQAIDNNLMTMEQVIRERNNGEFSDWRAVVDQRAIEKEYIEEKGLTLNEVMGNGNNTIQE
jgi:capsid protein